MEGKNGFALVMVIILIAFLSIVAIGLVALWQGAVNQLVKQEESMQAYYLARSGAAALASWVKAHPSTATSIANIQSQPIHLKTGSVGEVRVMLATSTTNNLTVISTGIVNNARETLKLTLVQEGKFEFTRTMIAKKFSPEIGSKIGGSVEYQGTGTVIVKHTSNYTVFYNPSIGATVLTDNNNNTPYSSSISQLQLTPLPLPSSPVSNMNIISSDTKISDGGSYYISSDVTVTVDSKGKSNSATLIIVSPKSVTIDLEDGSHFKSLYIYVPKGNVTIDAGSKGGTGSIVASDISFNPSNNSFALNQAATMSVYFPSNGNYFLGSWSY